MDSNEMFNWPDADVILRATHGTDSRDFQVHKAFLSFASPVFRDMFKLPQPPSPASNVVDVADPPRALGLVLRYIYPSAASPVVDLSVLPEALIIADKYDIEVARVRLRSSLKKFTKSEPLRTYAIACRLGFEDEMKIASSHTTSIHLPGLTQLPDEFKLIPATEYHRLILLHSTYRIHVKIIAARSPLTDPTFAVFGGLGRVEAERARSNAREAMWKRFIDRIGEGIPLDRESLALVLKADNGVAAFADSSIEVHLASILSQAHRLNLTV
jgi:hypothetical protein